MELALLWRRGRGLVPQLSCLHEILEGGFFRGASLRPVPPVASKHKDVRYFHIHEDERLDGAQLGDRVKQASQLPGERM